MRRVRSALSSLRWKLTVTFVALLAVLLAGLGAFQYLTLQRTLVDTRASALEAIAPYQAFVNWVRIMQINLSGNIFTVKQTSW